MISWIVSGLIVGAVAKLLMPGKDPGGFIITILLGIAGALLGGWMSTMMGFGQDGAPAGWIMSILGAVVLLAVYRLVARPTRTV
jgi:uncharacterized membrane protein YeaQ/YmgE (transglycosylase-associated protein family)